MPHYIRSRVEGGIYFFTVVTYHRLPILTCENSREILRAAWLDAENRFPFETLAICLLPDHLHCLWKLPSGDANYSTRWSEIKRLFTRNYLTEVGSNEKRNASRIKRQEGTIWQRRFWEHTIADEADYEFHLDYIHFNPIKHGYVSRAADWPWSSFQRFVKEGIYDPDWAGSAQDRLQRAAWE